MPHPTAPGPSSNELKTRIARFMRSAEEVLTHPLSDYQPGFQITLRFDTEGIQVAADMKNFSVDRQALVFLATTMRPIIFNQKDSIYLTNLTGRIEREHPAFQGKLKPFRQGFLNWLKTPMAYSGTVGEVPPQLQTDTPQVVGMVTAPPGTPVPLEGLSGDMHFADVFFNGEIWHSDDEKAAEYQAASPHEREFIAQCAELRTFHAIPFIRILHDWVVEVRRMEMDI